MNQKCKENDARLVRIPNHKWRHAAWRIARAGKQRYAAYKRRERVPTIAEAKQLAWNVAYGLVPFPLHHRDVILMSEPSFLPKHRAWRARRPMRLHLLLQQMAQSSTEKDSD